MKKSISLILSTIALGAYLALVGSLVISPSSCFSQDSVRGVGKIQKLTVANFDKGSLTNDLNGPSGTWALEENNENNVCRAELVSNPRVGDKGYSLQLSYNVDAPWSQKAVNGFWTKLNSINLSKFDHLEFYAKGSSTGDFPSTFKVQLTKYRNRETGEMMSGSYIIKDLGREWKKVSIPLNKMTGIVDWRKIEELVIVFQNRRLDRKIGTVFIDNIEFVRTGEPGPSQFDEVPWPVTKLPEDTKLSGLEYAKFQLEQLQNFPSKLYAKEKFPADDKELLLKIAQDTWRYFEDIIDKDSNLPHDNVELSKKSPLGKYTKIGDYTNVTNIGLYFMCVVSARDFGFITTERAMALVNKTLDSLEKLETYNGYYYNYYDTMMLFRTTHFLSFVDSGWLVSGLIVAKEAFDNEPLKKRCQDLIDKQDFSFYYDEVEGQFYHGFFDNLDVYSEYHYGTFYSEARTSSLMALGRNDVPLEHWFMMHRTMPESWLWQSQAPKGRIEKEYKGNFYHGGYYEYMGIKLIPSWGGSMFEALMPTLVLDEKNLARESLGLNDLNHALAQIKFAKEKDLPVWGFSPSSDPQGGYSEYGIKPCGIKPYSDTVVTPHASFLALEFAFEDAMENIRELKKRYKIYGEYGFYDAVDVKSSKVSLKYMCLDQAMILIAINNYLNDGSIRKYFHKHPDIKNIEHLLSIEKFFK